ncbi:MAG: exodeoxyribonuclease VII small subunit [Acholeplasmataceae bacterium]|nr:exodeoxyribonuclease VII small subunit [Acholeplasmataceae bacterium]
MPQRLSFEQALEKLEKVVKELESGELTLEEAIKKYEEGTKLAGHCRNLISNAESVIVKLMKGEVPEDFPDNPDDQA